MFVMRETVHCKPGKVRPMVEGFQRLAGPLKRLGFKPFRVYTDVSATRFWTVVVETEAASLDSLFEMQGKVMSDPEARDIMSGYHEFVESGRRELYRLEG